MAIRDVKQYYLKMLNQYLEVKADLEDFEVALKDGYITEEKLNNVKDDVMQIKNNVDRLSYILFLLDLPKRKRKRNKYKQENNNLTDYFTLTNSDEDALVNENTDVLKHLKEELEKLKQE